MKKTLLIIAFLLPVMALQAQKAKEKPAPKPHTKEISASKLPGSITKYISLNLPNATITRVIKQKRTPGEMYLVSVVIKTKRHTLVFDKKGNFVRLVKKRGK